MNARSIAAGWLLLAGALLLTAPVAPAEESSGVELLSQALYSSAFRVAVEGNILYVGCGATLLLYDRSDPRHPVPAGAFRTEGEIYGICVRAGRAYVATITEGVRIVDCTTPSSPTEIGFVENAPGGAAMGVFARGDTAFVADGAAGLLVVDCTTPSAPSPVATFPPPSTDRVMMDVALLGGTAYGAFSSVNLFGGTSSLSLIDCSDPDSLHLIDEVGTGLAGGYALSVGEDSTAYLANGFGLTLLGAFPFLIYDCSTPESITMRSYFQSPNPQATGCDVALDERYVYLASGYKSDGKRGGDTWYPNFQVFDREGPSGALTPLGETYTANFSLGVAVGDSIAYVADEWAGVQLIDVSSGESPDTLGHVDTGGYPEAIALLGSRAFLPSAGGKLRIVDRTDPLAPVELEPYRTIGGSFSVDIVGTTAYAGESFDFTQGLPGLTVLDVSDSIPALLGRFQAESDTFFFYDLEVQDTLAYVANGIGGLRVLSVASPENIYELSLSDAGSKCTGIFVDDTLAYLAAGEAGLEIWSVADPEHPVMRGAWVVSDSVFDVEVRNDTAYLACRTAGIHIVDCRDPSNIAPIGSYPTDDEAWRLTLSGKRIYAGCGNAGLRILDACDPVHLVERGYFDTPSRALGVAARRETVFVADPGGGLYTLRDLTATGIAGPAGGESLSLASSARAFPNPFRGSATIRFSRSDGGAPGASATIYSITGRVVRVLAPGAVTGSTADFVWDGLDDLRRAVGPGLYLYRIETTSALLTGRLVLVR